jgi:two-component system chemotaxis response regulator CheB
MADGDYHLRFRRDATRLCLERSHADPVHGQRPAVDELFSSLAVLTEAKGLAFLMTGMGKDGAEGLLQLKRTNRFLTVAQNPQTCVVYGMPRQAVQIGAALAEGDPESMRQAILAVAKSKD